MAEKGIREFVEAAARVRAAVPNAHFLVVGGGDPDKPDSISHTELRAAGEHVVVTGWRTDVGRRPASHDS